MIELLQKAVAEAAKLPEDEQRALAAWILEEIASERSWRDAIGKSFEDLADLADEALNEHKQGATQPLELRNT